jgi:glycosyltransferase involved in cell wall biosynthesis
VKLSVIVPVYNERNLIVKSVINLLETDLGVEREVIIVDDGSTDGTREIIEKELEPLVEKVIYLPKNRGKGAAMRAGFAMATGDYVIPHDADTEYDPEDIPRLLEPALKGRAEVVYGSRFTGPHRNMFYFHWIGNRFLTFVTNLLYNTTLSDMETCYKLIKRSLLEGIKIRSNRFGIEPELTAKLLKRRVRIYELPISYYGREFEEGKKITWRDGFSALWTLIKYRFVD